MTILTVLWACLSRAVKPCFSVLARFVLMLILIVASLAASVPTHARNLSGVFMEATMFDSTPDASTRDTIPDPSVVLRRSLMLPGWGQVTNRQVWKVPVFYGLMGGLTYYSITLDQRYRDFRAAFYNATREDSDERFGPTPEYLSGNINPQELRYARNQYRNRRDLAFIGIALAYGLTALDAYVFAHMRDFDVSDDLSARIYLDSDAGFASSTHWTDDHSRYPGEPNATVRLTLRLSIK